ncbi:uncharacterized protein AUP68_05080 [Ilyonectria robusta]
MAEQQQPPAVAASTEPETTTTTTAPAVATPAPPPQVDLVPGEDPEKLLTPTRHQLHSTHASPSDFADQFPAADIVGSDLSPCQPKWVPPNVRFQVDDATLSWTWKDDSFDFVHIRYLFGAIQDWNGLFKEAFRCCAPGGWVQSCEADVHFFSDDGTTDAEPVLKTWDKLYTDGGKATGRNFFILDDQRSAFKAAGFEDVNVVNYKARHPTLVKSLR